MTPINKPPARNTAMMLDIETLGLNPDSYVTQIGVCVADLDSRKFMVEPTNFWTTQEQPGKMDFGTIQWWMQQDRKVAESVFNAKVARNSAEDVFAYLKGMCSAYQCTVWASPAMFDLPILTHYFGGRKPWKYNDERCLMTLYKLLDPQRGLAPPKNEMAHDAASDARWQMEYLFNLHEKLQAMKTAYAPPAMSGLPV